MSAEHIQSVIDASSKCEDNFTETIDKLKSEDLRCWLVTEALFLHIYLRATLIDISKTQAK